MLGKIGKILEFLAGLSILIDIWGPDRIRSFGKTLSFWKAERAIEGRSDNFWRVVLGTVFGAWFLYALISILAAGPAVDEHMLSRLLGDLGAYFYIKEAPEVGRVPASLVVSFLSAIAMTIAFMLLLGVTAGVIEAAAPSIASRLEQPGSDNQLRKLAVVLLVLGFPLDLLFG